MDDMFEDYLVEQMEKKKLIFEDKKRLFLNERGMILINSILSNVLLKS